MRGSVLSGLKRSQERVNPRPLPQIRLVYPKRQSGSALRCLAENGSDFLSASVAKRRDHVDCFRTKTTVFSRNWLVYMAHFIVA